MPELEESLRKEAKRLFQVAVDAANPASALRRHFAESPLVAPEGRMIVISIGKAACPMMEEALKFIPAGVPCAALVVTNRENLRPIPGADVLPAGHPVPDLEGEAAGQAVMRLLNSAGPQDKVIALISGGGSALLPAPVQGVSLSDKAQVSEVLLAAGLDITDMNHIRQQLSQLKGGGFARLAAPATVSSFILSDVVGNDLRAIASGPTAEPIGTRASAKALLEDHDLFSRMPESVQTFLQTAEPRTPVTPPVENTLICSNHQSLEAMQAASTGWHAQIIADDLEGDVEDVAPLLLNIASKTPAQTALLFGGETTVTLRGTGRGGRNQELALRFALGADKMKGDWVFLSGGTDGRDGPTDAAGGLVSARSKSRMEQAGTNPDILLANNDSYAALDVAGDLLVTGGTGTNVADVQIFLRGPLPKP
ncbi:MAG: DUF4147 domain-containing protein [Pseudomonadota bacterium]